MDVGAGDGIATLEVLKRGGKVVANDLAAEHLEEIVKRTPPEYLDNLQTVSGKFPDVVDFPDDYFGAVLISRVFHFFNGEQIEDSLTKLFRLMCPGARIYIIADTVYMGHIKSLHAIYEENVRKGVKWPGFLDFKNLSGAQRALHTPDMMNFLDEAVLTRSLIEAGFVVDDVSLSTRPDYPDAVQFDGREGVGAIGSKP